MIVASNEGRSTGDPRAVRRRLPGDFGQDPFAAFDPPTELPPSYQLIDPGEVVRARALGNQRARVLSCLRSAYRVD